MPSGIRFRPAEAVAIVGEICRQRRRAHSPRIALARASSGSRADGEHRSSKAPCPPARTSVARAAHLLESLLPPFDAPPEFRASGALRLAIARALGTLDLPPFASLEEFSAALARFSTLDARETVTALWSRAWECRRRQPRLRHPRACSGRRTFAAEASSRRCAQRAASRGRCGSARRRPPLSSATS